MTVRSVADLARDAIGVCLATAARSWDDIDALIAPYRREPVAWRDLLVSVAAFAVAMGEQVAPTGGEAPAQLWRSLALEAARRQRP